MAVFRIERTRDYTVMSNHHLRNANLSLKAKGLLSMMLSLPEDWNYTTRGLAKICKEGVDAIGAALRELEGAGYIVRHQRRDKSGRITDTEYVIYEQPQPDLSQPDTASPDTENPDMVNPDTEKPAELNIEKSNTEKSITYGSSTDSIPFRETAAARPPERKGRDAMSVTEIENYRELILENIEYDCLKRRYPLYRDDLNEIVELLVETVCAKRKTTRISGADFPHEIVRSRFLKLDSSHIEFVMDCLHIYAFFMENHTDKEKVRFLKDEYGIGGRSHALSGATHSGEDHDGKGLHYKKQDCPDVHLNWEKVAKRITSLVQKGRYLTEQEQAQYDKIQAEKDLAEEDAIHARQPEIEEETPKPTLREQFEQYKPVVTAAISEDVAYRNACGHSDRENAVIEGNAAVRRAVLGSKDMELIRLYSDVPEFRQRLHREVIDETYPKLHELLRPLSQEDIDKALCVWNGNIESKHAVVRYMKDHAREKDTAAWLAQEYGGGNSPFVVRAGSPEETQLPWPKVQRRLAQLIQEDRFYTEEEQDRFDNIDPIAIREALEERGIVNGQVADPEKLDNSSFIQQVMSDVEQIAAAETEQTSEVSISDEEYDAVRRPTPQRTSYDPAAPVYAVGDSVYIEDDAYQITELREDTVQLLPTGMVYPIYRAERKEQFEQLLRADRRNAYYTEFLPIDPDKADQDLRDVLAHGLMDEADKKQLSTLLQSGRSNSEIAYWLSRAYPHEIETLNLETGDIADYRTTAQGMELEVMDAEEKRLAVLYFRWDEVAPLLRGMYARQLDGFGQEQPQPSAESPAFHSETVAVYPGDKNNLPYDVVVERLHIEEPEPPAPVTEPEKTFEEVLDEHPVSIQVNGQWQTFPNAKAAEEASYEEYKANLRRNAQNFRITDEHLGEGGPKAKFQANIEAIKLLKYLEETTGQATPEQQEVLSRYVGWGGLADAFDPEKPAWASEYAQLKELLTPEEYAAARSSTLNAHYTSPTVIQSIYEAVGRMGFETGNILDKTTPRLIQFHTLKNAVNPPFLGGFSIFNTVVA